MLREISATVFSNAQFSELAEEADNMLVLLQTTSSFDLNTVPLITLRVPSAPAPL